MNPAEPPQPDPHDRSEHEQRHEQRHEHELGRGHGHGQNREQEGKRETEGEENPYAMPLEGRWADEQPDGAAIPVARPPAPPWVGGWWLMTLVVLLVSGIGMALAAQANHPAVGALLIPILGLAAIAVVVRLLHTTVEVHWPLYLLIAGGFGIVSYFAFIPVCIAVGLPSMILLEGLFSHSDLSAPVAFTLVVAICGMLFTLLLRLYLRYRYRRQWYQQDAMQPPPLTDPTATHHPGTDPFGTPRK